MEGRVRKIIVVSVTVIVSLLMIGFIFSLVAVNNGDMNQDTFMLICFLFTGTITTVVIIAGVFLINVESTKDQFERYLKEREDEQNK